MILLQRLLYRSREGESWSNMATRPFGERADVKQIQSVLFEEYDQSCPEFGPYIFGISRDVALPANGQGWVFTAPSRVFFN